MRNGLMQPAIATGVTNNLTTLQDTLSNLERICNTPLPFAYQAHLRMSLWWVCFLFCAGNFSHTTLRLYLFFLPVSRWLIFLKCLFGLLIDCISSKSIPLSNGSLFQGLLSPRSCFLDSSRLVKKCMWSFVIRKSLISDQPQSAKILSTMTWTIWTWTTSASPSNASCTLSLL